MEGHKPYTCSHSLKELSHGILSYFCAYKITFKLKETWK